MRTELVRNKETLRKIEEKGALYLDSERVGISETHDKGRERREFDTQTT